jgi:hypothetical protein
MAFLYCDATMVGGGNRCIVTIISNFEDAAFARDQARKSFFDLVVIRLSAIR